MSLEVSYIWEEPLQTFMKFNIILIFFLPLKEKLEKILIQNFFKFKSIETDMFEVEKLFCDV